MIETNLNLLGIGGSRTKKIQNMILRDDSSSLRYSSSKNCNNLVNYGGTTVNASVSLKWLSPRLCYS